MRSLKAHHQDVLLEENIQASDILCLAETHIQDYTPYDIKHMQCISNQSKHGCAIYIGKPVTCKLKMHTTELLESVGAVIENMVLVYVFIFLQM